MSRRDERDDGLDVVELLADEDDERNPVDAEERPRPFNRRLIVGVACTVVVALVAYSLTASGDDPAADDVGIASPSTTDDERDDDSTPTTRRAAPEPLPDIDPGPFLTSLGGRVALTRAGEVLTLDPQRAQFTRVPEVDDSGVSLVGSVAGSFLVATSDRYYVVPTAGEIVEIPSAPFPAADGSGWWNGGAGALTPIGFESGTVKLPSRTDAVAAVRDGFLLRGTDSGALMTWSAGDAVVPIEGSTDAAVAAVHPDRIAWYNDCIDTGSCTLHVTDLVSRNTVDLPGVLPLFTSGHAAGRFSPDASRLALNVSAATGNDAELVVFDLTTGALVVQEPLAAAASPYSVAPFLRAVPFDFTRDSSQLILVAGTGASRQLVTIDFADGSRQLGGSAMRGITSIVALDVERSQPAAEPAAPAAGPADVVIASMTNTGPGTELVLVDVGAGTRREVDLPRNVRLGGGESFGPGVVGLPGGFLANARGGAWWIPDTGDPIPLGPADLVTMSSDRSRGWLFLQRDDAGYEVTSLDGQTGAMRTERPVQTIPVAVVGEEFVRTIYPSFDSGTRLEFWNVRTGTSRLVDIPGGDNVGVATNRHVLWMQRSCYEAVETCTTGLRATDVETAETTTISVQADPYASPNAIAGDGVYLWVANSITRVDAATGAVEQVPGSDGVEQLAASPDGGVVFGAESGIYAWRPGLPDPIRISAGSFDDDMFGGNALAVR